jgi:aryl-alcohol dehydrogenase-like predicted oxidoreductase
MLVRGIEADVLACCERYGIAVIPWSPLAGGWLSGQYRTGGEIPLSRRAERLPARFDASLAGNRAKLEAAEALAVLAEEAGLSLIELAIAWVINHPAVTAAIIGPRTLEHLESQLPALGHKLDAALLDRIDEIVPPGVNLNSADGGYADPALAPAARRR